MEKLSKILHNLDQGNINVELAEQQVLDLFVVSSSAIDVIKWMADCPYSIDPATVPKNGVEVAPKQVVGNMSLSYVKYKQLCDVAKQIEVLGQSEQLKCPTCELYYDKEEIEMFRGLCESCRDRAF